jgi:hypothetical protein
MIRGLLIIAFTLSVVGNSLAAQVGNDECGPCCLTANNQPGLSLSKECCYSECGEPGETQPTFPTVVAGIERIHKVDGPIAVVLVAPIEGRSSTDLPSTARNVIQSTHIYLRTGTLLI